MFKNVTKFIRNDAVIELFNHFEEPAYLILLNYLKEYEWVDLVKRLKESRFVGVGTYRMLTNISINYLDDSVENLINFYERCKRPKDDPHYEDLIVTILIGVVTGILANICYDFIKNQFSYNNPKKHKQLADELWKEYAGGINYLFRAKWAREMLWNKQISKEEHTFLLQNLKLKYLMIQTTQVEKADSDNLLKIELEFQEIAKNYDLALEDLQASLLNKLIELAFEQIKFNNEIIIEFESFFKEREYGKNR